MKKTWIPNLLTGCRMIGTVAMLFLQPLSKPFFVAYTLSGVSDVLDGSAARLLHCTSDFGAKLDSWADLLFYGAMIVRMLPVLAALLPGVIWWILAAVLLIRLASYLTAWGKFHVFSSMHTWLNKITGLGVFLIPYAVVTPWGTPYCFAAVTLGCISSLEELTIHLTSHTYNPNRKSILG